MTNELYFLRFFVFSATCVMSLSHLLAGSASGQEQGRHDLLVLLPSRVVHIRLDIQSNGIALESVRSNYMAELIAKLDTNSNGKLDRAETLKHPLFATRRRFVNNEFLRSLRERESYSDADVKLAIERAAGQLVVYRQNDSLAEQDLSVFRVLDSDGSGKIDRLEMRMSPARIAERDFDLDQCITFDEFVVSDAADPRLAAINAINSEPPATIHSELLRNANDHLMPARLVRRYDENKDAHLSQTEIGWSDKKFTELDIDQNQLLSMQELASLRDSSPDVTLQIDLGRNSPDSMKQIQNNIEPSHNVSTDVVRVSHEKLNLDITYRWHDPLAESKSNALAVFNVMDQDENGYLDRDEIVGHQRFENYLFDGMDADDDDRVFATEMLDFVKEYTLPASTTCQITMLDTGNGFFQFLDANGDGRISLRELRSCEERLLNVAGEQSELNPSRLAKAYRIEIQRGGIGLFGKVDRPSADLPAAFLKPPQGPIWFQRMDRNSDGDLTWDEFLGPREIFHELDADHDGLIDAREAEQTTSKSE